jgi:hypothetical protein
MCVSEEGISRVMKTGNEWRIEGVSSIVGRYRVKNVFRLELVREVDEVIIHSDRGSSSRWYSTKQSRVEPPVFSSWWPKNGYDGCALYNLGPVNNLYSAAAAGQHTKDAVLVGLLSCQVHDRGGPAQNTTVTSHHQSHQKSVNFLKF